MEHVNRVPAFAQSLVITAESRIAVRLFCLPVRGFFRTMQEEGTGFRRLGLHEHLAGELLDESFELEREEGHENIGCRPV